ncbi:hypothetical protein BDR03DRAFT_963506 [Suillus americanus]|nr:hypothetical protein BDR03DRAFT_963506 [Suillus americanus]
MKKKKRNTARESWKHKSFEEAHGPNFSRREVHDGLTMENRRGTWYNKEINVNE